MTESVDIGTAETTEDDSETHTESADSATEGPRAVAFETATAKLSEVFEVDGRRGETITDLRTTETDEGRQLVATVEESRSTMVSHRLDSARRTGRRAGSRIAVLAGLAAVGYVVLALRRLFGGDGDAAEEYADDPASDD